MSSQQPRLPLIFSGNSSLIFIFSFWRVWSIQFYLRLVICSVIFISFICFHSSSFIIITGYLTFTMNKTHVCLKRMRILILLHQLYTISENHGVASEYSSLSKYCAQRRWLQCIKVFCSFCTYLKMFCSFCIPHIWKCSAVPVCLISENVLQFLYTSYLKKTYWNTLKTLWCCDSSVIIATKL
jgi:hypothetical protein